jgi:hypothetical protein
VITIPEILKAIRMMIDIKEWDKASTTHKQIVSSLGVYEQRGEFNPESENALKEAIECLELACYEIAGRQATEDEQINEYNVGE